MLLARTQAGMRSTSAEISQIFLEVCKIRDQGLNVETGALVAETQRLVDDLTSFIHNLTLGDNNNN